LRGVTFNYQITATGSPAGFGLVGQLPPGVHFDVATGTISGAPTAEGLFEVTISATNQSGTGNRPISITVGRGVVSLGEAVDALNYVWISGGADFWIGEVDVTFDGIDAAESGVISDSQTSHLDTTVTGPCAVSFRWKVDSEPENDALVLSVNGVERSRISGQQDWLRHSFTLPPGEHALRWEYRKNESISQGLDRAWVDNVSISFLSTPTIISPSELVGEVGENFRYQIEADNSPTSLSVSGVLPEGLSFDSKEGVITGIPVLDGVYQFTISATNDAGTTNKLVTLTITPPIVTISESVDAEEFPWNTFGDKPWFPQTIVTSDGEHAAQSGDVRDGESSAFQVSVIGPVAVRFRWKVSSEANYDALELRIDGELEAKISGEVDWQEKVVAVPTGVRTLSWQYRKDGSISTGADGGWLDRFQIDNSPLIAGLVKTVGQVGLPFAFQIGALNQATSFSATNLPPGLSVDEATGLISGRPEQAGKFISTLATSNTHGADSRDLEIIILPATNGDDSFAKATTLEGAWIHLLTNNAPATSAVGEPNHAGKPGGHSIWWTWTAPSSGVVSISTAGSVFDTLLSVYQGDNLAGLVPVASNDNASKSKSSKVRFRAEKGQVYRIAVDGVGGAFGDITLDLAYEKAANYSALLFDLETGDVGGLVTLSLTQAQRYTGRMSIGKFRYAFKGQLSATNQEVYELRAKGGPSARVVMKSEPRFGTSLVEGAVQSAGKNYSFLARRSIAPDDLPSNAVGDYTLLVEPDAADASLPGGTGYAKAKLDRSGKLRISGVLGDGVTFSAGGSIDLQSTLPFFVAPYPGGGLMGGPLSFDLSAANPVFSGQADWNKLADPGSKTYRNGFVKMASVRGGRYVRPARGVRILTFGNGMVRFFGSDVAISPSEQAVVVSDKNTVSGASGIPGFTMKIDTSTGLFRGAVRATGAVKRSFGGAILPAEDRGAGVFTGTVQTGGVSFEVAP
jgi:hypothetical protein